MLDDLLDDEPEEEAHLVNDARRADEIQKKLIEAGGNWRSGTTLDLGGVKWTPHLVSQDERDVVHIHLADELPRYIQRRLAAAVSRGLRIRVALTLEALYDYDVLTSLSDVDAYVFVVSEDGEIDGPHHFLAALGDQDVPVDHDLRVRLATATWSRRADGGSHEKGRRLEALLAFLLGQVSDFAIRSRNFRGDTDEIDIVVQIVGPSNHCWREEGVPFILVESKNWVEKSGQAQISLLIRHMDTRRGRVRIGMFFSANGFTSDARDEVLKLASTPLCVVLAGPDEIEEWIAASDPDRFLEDLVAAPMLR